MNQTQQIYTEHDHDKFNQLIEKLIAVLDRYDLLTRRRES
jgi:hypothetical protein